MIAMSVIRPRTMTVCTGVMPPNMVVAEMEEQEYIGIVLSVRRTWAVPVSMRRYSLSEGRHGDIAQVLDTLVDALPTQVLPLGTKPPAD